MTVNPSRKVKKQIKRTKARQKLIRQKMKELLKMIEERDK